MEALGLVLQLLGGLIALFGLDDSTRQIFPETGGIVVVKHVRRAALWLAYRLGKKRPTVSVVAGTATGYVESLGGAARGTASLPAGATVDQHIERLYELIANTDQRAEETRKLARTWVDTLGKRLGDAEERINRTIERRHAETRLMIAGRNGSGFKVQALGVAIALVGTLVAAVG